MARGTRRGRQKVAILLNNRFKGFVALGIFKRLLFIESHSVVDGWLERGRGGGLIKNIL